MATSSSMVDHVVVDAGGFIRNASIREIGEEVYSVPEVVNEISDKATKQRLQVLPYTLNLKNPSAEAVVFVSDFAKKTGDYKHLSKTDISVLALTYMLEKQYVGEEHIRKEPLNKPAEYVVPSKASAGQHMAGFYLGPEKQNLPNEENQDASEPMSDAPETGDILPENQDASEPMSDVPETGDILPENQDTSEPVTEVPETGDILPENQDASEPMTDVPETGDILPESLLEEEEDEEEEEESEEEEDDDDEGWITPSNIKRVKQQMRIGKGVTDKTQVKVACLTTDFAMQLPSEENQDASEPMSDAPETGDILPENQDASEPMSDAPATGDILPENQDASELISDVPETGDVLPESLLEEEEEEESEEEEDDDDEGWITPSNIKSVKQQMGIGKGVTDKTQVKVACLTTDFAMQNVLIQMGLNVVSVDGMLIKQARSYVLRCFACMKITYNTMKTFCPNCGNKTLKRVAMMRDEEGKVHYFFSRRPLNTRGMKYPLPKPQGGKHGNNPLLFEDQPVPQQRARKSKQLSVFDDDYIARNSPFAVHDITSRAATVGVTSQRDFRNAAYWNKKNPNEPRRRHGRKKKTRHEIFP